MCSVDNESFGVFFIFIRAAAEIYYQNSCQSRFSGVYLAFAVFQDIWHSNKDTSIVYAGMLRYLVP